jgi:hypothetical protein|tara:strand:+ start:3028 stop:3342 length:315 start_codon:yes stop_codon:yes gene_type:complete
MSQEPRKLRKLLEILAEHNVIRYKSDEIEVEMCPPGGDLSLAKAMYDGALEEVNEKDVANPSFSMDNYVNSSEVNVKAGGNGVELPEDAQEYSEKEMLYWSAES